METTIDCVVAPFDQVFPVAELDVKVTVLPAQNVSEPLVVIVGVGGFGLTVTVVDADVAVQPAEPTVTEYVPLVETVIDWVVSPVDHVLPVAELEVKVSEAP